MMKWKAAISYLVLSWAGLGPLFGCGPNKAEDPTARTAVRGKESPPKAPLVESCRSLQAGNVCLGVKYVVYRNGLGQEAVPMQRIRESLSEVNEIWRRCRIGFQIEDFEYADPTDYGLPYESSEEWELDRIRSIFRSEDRLLIVVTGKWRRALGWSGANAWTSMPELEMGRGEVFGTVLEPTAQTTPNLVAHELGHYLSLDHVEDARNLMNPLIYPESLEIDSAQCRGARWAARNYWAKMLRG